MSFGWELAALWGVLHRGGIKGRTRADACAKLLPTNIANTFQHVFDRENEERRIQENNAANSDTDNVEHMQVSNK